MLTLLMMYPDREEAREALNLTDKMMQEKITKTFLMMDDISNNAHSIVEQYHTSLQKYKLALKQ